MATTTKAKPSAALQEVEKLLDYRLPNNGKPLSYVVLPRDVAEALRREFYALQIQAEGKGP